jgi:hypothetical protein
VDGEVTKNNIVPTVSSCRLHFRQAGGIVKNVAMAGTATVDTNSAIAENPIIGQRRDESHNNASLACK